jgi:hypothetical protein
MHSDQDSVCASSQPEMSYGSLRSIFMYRVYLARFGIYHRTLKNFIYDLHIGMFEDCREKVREKIKLK